MGELYEKLTEYGKSDYYPYHMPGHKRRMEGYPLEMYYNIDITEIEGFDNLHQAEGILLDLEKRINRLYGADETFLLVNGSTGGILSAVSCAVDLGGKLLIARNCHKSVYHAAYLRNCDIRYVYPEVSGKFGIALGIRPQDVEKALKAEAGIEAVVITSPTYEGVLSDIREIAKIVHGFGIPLIVDEAHGAHLGLWEASPESAVKAGADIVIHSLHKTLPSPTQTALLHVAGSRINRERLKRYLGIYQSSSPSYPLMAGIELCFDFLEKEGQSRFRQMLADWEKMLKRLDKCRFFRILKRQDVLQEGMKDFDVGKLVISTKTTGWSGQRLYEVLLERYHLQTEMAGDCYVLAMFTLMDTAEGYERMAQAMLELDAQLASEGKAGIGEDDRGWERKHTRLRTVCRMREALDAEAEWVDVSKSGGRTAAGFVNLYPPGIPVVVPGEAYSKEVIKDLSDWDKKGMNVQGMRGHRELPCVLGKAEEAVFEQSAVKAAEGKPHEQIFYR